MTASPALRALAPDDSASPLATLLWTGFVLVCLFLPLILFSFVFLLWIYKWIYKWLSLPLPLTLTLKSSYYYLIESGLLLILFY